MKKTLAVIGVGAALIVGINIGLEWGLTSKPVLDLDKCSEVIRFEDNSLMCKSQGREFTMSSDDGETKAEPLTVGTAGFERVQPMTGAEAQPAETIEHYQPAKSQR